MFAYTVCNPICMQRGNIFLKHTCGWSTRGIPGAYCITMFCTRVLYLICLLEARLLLSAVVQELRPAVLQVLQPGLNLLLGRVAHSKHSLAFLWFPTCHLRHLSVSQSAHFRTAKGKCLISSHACYDSNYAQMYVQKNVSRPVEGAFLGKLWVGGMKHRNHYCINDFFSQQLQTGFFSPVLLY